MKIRAGTVEHAVLPVLLKRDLDTMGAQMVERRRVVVVGNREGMMHAAMIVGHRIDCRVALYQDEARNPGASDLTVALDPAFAGATRAEAMLIGIL